MAEESKRKRIVALGKFTRNANHLTKLIEDAAPSNLVDPSAEKVKTAWEDLEAAHDDYLVQNGVDLDAVGVQDYLDDPGGRYSAVMLGYSQYLKDKSESDEKLAGQKADADRRLDDERRRREAAEMREAEVKKKEEKVESEFLTVSAEVG